MKKQASHEIKIIATSGIPLGKEIDVSSTLPGIFLPAAHTRLVESTQINGTVNEINSATDEAIREFLMLAVIFLVMVTRGLRNERDFSVPSESRVQRLAALTEGTGKNLGKAASAALAMRRSSSCRRCSDESGAFSTARHTSRQSEAHTSHPA